MKFNSMCSTALKILVKRQRSVQMMPNSRIWTSSHWRIPGENEMSVNFVLQGRNFALALQLQLLKQNLLWHTKLCWAKAEAWELTSRTSIELVDLWELASWELLLLLVCPLLCWVVLFLEVGTVQSTLTERTGAAYSLLLRLMLWITFSLAMLFRHQEWWSKSSTEGRLLTACIYQQYLSRTWGRPQCNTATSTSRSCASAELSLLLKSLKARSNTLRWSIEQLQIILNLQVSFQKVDDAYYPKQTLLLKFIISIHP